MALEKTFKTSAFLDHEGRIALHATAQHTNTPTLALSLQFYFQGSEPFITCKHNFDTLGRLFFDITNYLGRSSLFDETGLSGVRFEVYDAREQPWFGGYTSICDLCVLMFIQQRWSLCSSTPSRQYL